MTIHTNVLHKLQPKDFKELYDYILINEDEMDQVDGLNILVKCSHICIGDYNGKTSHQLKYVLEKAFSFISNLNEKQLVQYVLSIFHIVKYLIEKVS